MFHRRLRYVQAFVLAFASTAMFAGRPFVPDARGIGLPGSLTVTARVSKLGEKTRVIDAVTWIRVTSPSAPGTLPAELAELIVQFRARAADIRKRAQTLQEFRLATRYESVASQLELYREQDIQFSLMDRTRLTRPTRDNLSMVGLGQTVIATGIGTNFNPKGEPALIELTKDVVEVNPDYPIAATDGIGTGFTIGNLPVSPAPMITSMAGKVIGQKPLTIQTLTGTQIILIQKPGTSIGFQHDAPIGIAELKIGDRIEVVAQRTAKGGLAAMLIRITPPKPVGGAMFDLP